MRTRLQLAVQISALILDCYLIREMSCIHDEEITRYICEKIALEEADFLSDKTKDSFRTLYRLIAERIRQQQKMVKADLSKIPRPKT